MKWILILLLGLAACNTTKKAKLTYRLTADSVSMQKVHSAAKSSTDSIYDRFVSVNANRFTEITYRRDTQGKELIPTIRIYEKTSSQVKEAGKVVKADSSLTTTETQTKTKTQITEKAKQKESKRFPVLLGVLILAAMLLFVIKKVL